MEGSGSTDITRETLLDTCLQVCQANLAYAQHEIKRLKAAIAAHKEDDRHHLYKPYRHDIELWEHLDGPAN
jgi:hypothetical protein